MGVTERVGLNGEERRGRTFWVTSPACEVRRTECTRNRRARLLVRVNAKIKSGVLPRVASDLRARNTAFFLLSLNQPSGNPKRPWILTT